MFKTLQLITLIFIGLMTFCSDNDDAEKKPVDNEPNLKKKAEIVQGAEKFGIDLLKTMNRINPEDNIVISPLSASMALGMSLNGAAGQTYDEIAQVLNFNEISQDQINDTYHYLLTRLPELDPKVTTEIANSAWYRNDVNMKSEFLKNTTESFLAKIAAADFNDPGTVALINTWIENNTNGLIKNMLDYIPSDAILYLINTVYFKGTWTYQFNKEETREGTFYRGEEDFVNCSYMAQSNQFDQLVRDDVKGVKLPYGDGKYSMLLMLPTENDIDAFISDLSQERWKSYLDGFVQDTGYIEVPKFKIEYKNLLNDALIEMGMPTAFSGGADFSNICDRDIFISRVIHQTIIEVDEAGTEAAGATIIEFRENASELFTLTLHRPFVFAIIENDSNSILFMGKVSDPS